MRAGTSALGFCCGMWFMEAPGSQGKSQARTIQLLTLTLALALVGSANDLVAEELSSSVAAEPREEQAWPWPESLDAVAAAPESHEILLENDSVRVIRVYIPASTREPKHTHRWPSVMIVDQPTRIRYYDEKGELVFESPALIERTPRQPEWMAREGPHSVENLDTTPYYAYRIELKQGGGE